jgi:adenylate cyclase
MWLKGGFGHPFFMVGPEHAFAVLEIISLFRQMPHKRVIRLIYVSSLLLFLAANSCLAGASDSLLQVIRSGPSDTLRVNRLLELSKMLLNDKPEASIQHATEAAELSASLRYGAGLAQSEKSIGLAYYMQGDYIQTLTHWNRSKDIFDSIGDLRGSANLLSNLGAVYFNQGDDATALEYYLKSLKIAERIGDSLRILTNYQNIGAVHLNKKITHDQALAYFLKALPITEQLNDNDATGTVTVNIGEIYLEKGQLDTALYYFEISRKALQQSENLPYTLFSIGKVYMMKKDFARAMSFQRSAFEYAKKLDSKNDMAISLIGLGKVQVESGDYADALNSFTQGPIPKWGITPRHLNTRMHCWPSKTPYSTSISRKNWGHCSLPLILKRRNRKSTC